MKGLLYSRSLPLSPMQNRGLDFPNRVIIINKSAISDGIEKKRKKKGRCKIMYHQRS